MSNYTKSNPKKQNKYPPELPKKARLAPDLGLDACPWLDDYIEFSNKWSPRSYDGYHEAVGLWVLSTIAARRVEILFGKPRYTNLYILIVGRTTLHAKSTAAQIGKELISKLGLGFLLLPDECTPQRMLMEMASKLPDDYAKLNADQKERIKRSLAFAGQRGWYFDEFGANIQAMMRRDGPYSEFRGIFRRFDDTEDSYKRATVGRGQDLVIRPYLALLGVLTPSDLMRVADRGSALWGDGYLARMAMVIPPEGLIKNGQFPRGERMFPVSLLKPLREWHERLETSEVVIKNGVLTPPEYKPVSMLELSEKAKNAYYNYDEALRDILTNNNLPDLDGNYGRLPDKALRIAGLFASLTNSPVIEIIHWARAQEIVERWRRDLHELYWQVNQNNQKVQVLSNEWKVKRAITHNGFPTSREIQQFTGLKNDEVEKILEKLIAEEKIIAKPVGRTTRYRQASLENIEE